MHYLKRVFIIFINIIFLVNAYGQINNIELERIIKFESKRKAKYFDKSGNEKNEGNLDFKYIEFNWELNPDTFYIKGNLNYNYTPYQNIKSCYLQLTNNLIIDTLYGDNISSYFHLNDSIYINFYDSIYYDSIYKFSINYHGLPDSASNNSFMRTFHNEIPIIWTLSEPYGAADWWPCQQTLIDKIDSIKINIKCPNNYTAISNGKLISSISSNNFTNFIYKHDYPIATYLIGCAVTEYDTIVNYYFNGKDTLPIITYSYPENLENNKRECSNIPNFMRVFDSIFIPYPFTDEYYRQAEFGFGGGMEHQTVSFIGHFSFEVISHELAHQWFGDYITCGSWKDIWLNEGFATYCTALCYENLEKGYWWGVWKDEVIKKICNKPDGSIFIEDTLNVSDLFDGRLTYYKGAYFLHMLRFVIGDDAFFKSINEYLLDSENSYGFSESSNLIFHFENNSDTSLNEFFNDWYYGHGYPTYEILWTQDTLNNLFLTVNQFQSDLSVNFFEMPIEFRIEFENSDSLIIINNNVNNESFIIELENKVIDIVFDPLKNIISKDNIVTNINKSKDENIVNIFPIPTINRIFIKNKDFNKLDIHLSNIIGENLLEYKGVSEELIDIDLSSLKSGMYWIIIEYDNQKISKKVIKI